VTDHARVQSGLPQSPGSVPEALDPAFLSLSGLWILFKRQRYFILFLLGGLLCLCALVCMLLPRQYEAAARVEMRSTQASSLNLDAVPSTFPSSLLTAPVALETIADLFRSDNLAWRVIVKERLYQASGFKDGFDRRFPGFHPDQPTPAARAWLLMRFHARLHVQALPRALVLELRFRSRDAALSAAIVNALIRAYGDQQNDQRREATLDDSAWMSAQLQQLKARVDSDQRKLGDFQKANGIVTSAQVLSNGTTAETQHDPTLDEIDEIGHQIAAATSERILAEAALKAASEGDPELVVATDAHLASATSEFPVALLQQIRSRRSELEQERAQLSAEHGSNFPRVVEIGHQLQDLDAQKKTEDGRLLARFSRSLETARSRESRLRENLAVVTREGLNKNQAATEYALMRQEANTSHDLYLRLLSKVDEAGVTSGVRGSNLTVIDSALEPAKPVRPNPPLYFAVTFFIGLWLAFLLALLRESRLAQPLLKTAAPAVLLFLLLAGANRDLSAQAPAPSTNGLPTGVARMAASPTPHPTPDPKTSPMVWNQELGAGQGSAGAGLAAANTQPMAAPITPDDVLDVSESHTPEFHSQVRVSTTGTIKLPMVNEISVKGLNAEQAAHAIESALHDKGMLLHPLVLVAVTFYAGQDVSVLGEVARPGVYPYTLHHRLLDLLSAASGLSSTAGRLVTILHRDDPHTPHPVVLDPAGVDQASDHNPELKPGDTVQVSRAGLIYVIGAVIRPGGFPVDPVQGLTVVQALSLAWGPNQNAAVGHALLIREQKGGRTMTSLNLRKMLRGQEPDQPIRDRDILFVPDSTVRNLWNRTMESAIQSAIGVSIYSGLVYSQRY